MRKEWAIFAVCLGLAVFSLNVFLLHKELTVHCPPVRETLPPPPKDLLAVVINGGKRRNDISALLADLTNLSIPWVVFSDGDNIDQKRGDMRQPSFPRFLWRGKDGLKSKTWRINLLWYDLIPRLLDERTNERFFIVENDVVICNETMLLEAIRYFEDGKEKSLSLWQSESCTHGDPIVLENYTNLELFPRRPCGMVATLFDRRGLRLVRHQLGHMMEKKSIEFALKRSRAYKYSVRNGVIIHSGGKTTDGRKKHLYTCESTRWESWNEKSYENNGSSPER